MKKLTKYYNVRMNGIDTRASSLPEVKKLIHGKKEWRVSLFVTDGTLGGIKCLETTWYNFYEILRKGKWEIDKSSGLDRFSLSIYKSRIAK